MSIPNLYRAGSPLVKPDGELTPDGKRLADEIANRQAATPKANVLYACTAALAVATDNPELQVHGAIRLAAGHSIISNAELERLRGEATQKDKLAAEMLNRCIAIAIGCKDYGGGYGDDAMRAAFHHGMETVQRCLEALRDDTPNYQLAVVESIGRAAVQARSEDDDTAGGAL